MKKFAVNMVLINGIFLILIGLFHLLAIWIIGEKLFDFQITGDIRAEFILWFEMAGVFFVFIGIVEWFAFTGIKQNLKLGFQLALFSTITTVVLSSLGTLFLGIGPPLLILIFGVVTLFPLIYKRNEIQIGLR